MRPSNKLKIIDLALNGLTALAAAIFVAYLGLDDGTGLFAALPDEISGFFQGIPALQYVALAVVVAALIFKIPVGRALTRQKSERRG